MDRASCDLIGGQGRCYATVARGAHESGGSAPSTIRLTAEGGRLTVESLRIYAMRSIWR